MRVRSMRSTWFYAIPVALILFAIVWSVYNLVIVFSQVMLVLCNVPEYNRLVYIFSHLPLSKNNVFWNRWTFVLSKLAIWPGMQDHKLFSPV